MTSILPRGTAPQLGCQPNRQQTQVDPIEGGSCNDYDYVCGDPINSLDLDGLCKERKAGWNVWRHARNFRCKASRVLKEAEASWHEGRSIVVRFLARSRDYVLHISRPGFHLLVAVPFKLMYRLYQGLLRGAPGGPFIPPIPRCNLMPDCDPSTGRRRQSEHHV